MSVAPPVHQLLVGFARPTCLFYQLGQPDKSGSYVLTFNAECINVKLAVIT
jgi:hypothetical protein